MIVRKRIRLFLPVMLFLLWGCGGNKLIPSDFGVVRDSPSFADDIQPIFAYRNCATSGCHDPVTAKARLVLVPGQAYFALVGVPSAEDSTKRLVVPDSVSFSYLVTKIADLDQPYGVRMPAGFRPLDSASIQNIKNWIANGALNN